MNREMKKKRKYTKPSKEQKTLDVETLERAMDIYPNATAFARAFYADELARGLRAGERPKKGRVFAMRQRVRLAAERLEVTWRFKSEGIGRPPSVV